MTDTNTTGFRWESFKAGARVGVRAGLAMVAAGMLTVLVFVVAAGIVEALI